MQETDSVLGSERSPREGNGNPLQCSSLGNMNRVATVYVVAKSWTWLVNVTQTHSLSLYVAAAAAAAAAKSLQSCPTLCDPTDRSPPGSPVPGILQARTLEWVAISSSNA